MKMFTALAILITVYSGTLAEVSPRHVENEGGFSFRAPKGWMFREVPGMRYMVAFGTADNNFNPNINVVDEAFSGSLSEYVDQNIAIMRRMFQQFKLLSRTGFSTDSKLTGEFVTINALQQRRLLKQYFFLVEGSRGKKLVITCSCPAVASERFDKIFEECLKTFETE
ncbi:MAG: DcrB-related protein [Chitinispirillaceae bacterium]|nr:DcrB-related protein [Chitinispirillaceae bacterium]